MNLNESLTFRNVQGDGFKLAATVLGQMLTYAQHELALKEAGGILLGRYILDSNDAVVDQVTVPTPGDVRTRVNFVRAKRGHQESADQAWSNSRGTRHYLGEWHTHPEPLPKPSQVDLMNWKRLLAYYRNDPDPLYFVIVGTEAICAWQGRKTGVIEVLTLSYTGEGEL